jgi:hypothetical protein
MLRRTDADVKKARHAAMNRSFGRQIFEGAGRFNDFAPWRKDGTATPHSADAPARTM